jgi:hypothetical protein
LSVVFPSSPLSRSAIDTNITFLTMDTVSDEPCDLSGILSQAIVAHQGVGIFLVLLPLAQGSLMRMKYHLLMLL